MTLPLITPHDLALGVEGYILVHLILYGINEVMKRVYKQVVNTHELQVLYAHVYNKRIGKHHTASASVCQIGDCGTMKTRRKSLELLNPWHYPEEPLVQ